MSALESPAPEGRGPQLIVVCGLPGSGKTALAKRLARELKASWISSDAVRSECGLRGDYSKESIAAVYREMMARAEAVLRLRSRVVLDGSFGSSRFRDQARQLTVAAGVPLALIRMVADEETTLRRVGRRRKLTEAGPEAYRLLKEHFDPVESPHLELDSSRTSHKRLLKKALKYVSEY